MAAHIENALKIMKDTSDINDNRTGKKQEGCTEPKNSDDVDLINFEQMVIKKKNPYLDLKEFELKYYNPKNTRQNLEPGSNFEEDPSLCESFEDVPNVEITNRGLSGFAIPKKLLTDKIKTANNIKLENPPNDSAIKITSKMSKKQSDYPNRDLQLLPTLENDIRQFEESQVIYL
ncbi:Uncharacterized protein OBRU01_10483 [Operophtera brumata]|uniref:Uncharacterized protein n=1 Tax=Operophtera brumata TaxID=104452 RepID=A0A0L7LE37_OPEBR|nr:Uncharacterized protein OBRU01_10483 [Operophtera brumata]